MMLFRGLTESGDWQFGRGKQCYTKENDAIADNLETKLKTFYGECFFDPQEGVAWLDLLGSKDSAPLLLTLRSKIMSTYGVIGIRDVSYTISETRKILIQYSIDTIYTIGVVGSITI